MNVKVVNKKESEIRNSLQLEIIKRIADFKKSLQLNNSDIKLKFIKLLRLGILYSNMKNIPYRKSIEEEKLILLFEKCIELFMTSKEKFKLEKINRMLEMIGKAKSEQIMKYFIDMNLELIIRSEIENIEVPKYYIGRLRRARKKHL